MRRYKSNIGLKLYQRFFGFPITEIKGKRLLDVGSAKAQFQTEAEKLGAPVGHEKYERQQPEPTNNAAERALCELIVLRKIIGGLRRETGAQNLERIVTMLATWKQQEKPLFPTLKQAINC